MKENTEHKEIELYFDGKPSADILDILKGNGWHWHNVKKCWYVKDTASSRQIANQLVKKPVKAASEPVQKEDKPAAKADKPAAAKASKQTIVISIEEYNELLNYKKRFETIQGLLKSQALAAKGGRLPLLYYAGLIPFALLAVVLCVTLTKNWRV